MNMDTGNFRLPQRWPLYAGIAAIVLLTVLACWWLLRPGQQLLFGKLREADAAEIVAALDEWKIPHRIVDGGSGITVPADRVHDTRMKLVSAGIPKGGHVGFELFDDADFGVTEFAQRVNFQRALQGEIERTIAALPGVEAARVHLTIQRPGLFVTEKEVSKASVSLLLEPGATVSGAQVAGIQGLVSSAVEGLAPESVVVLGRHGEMLGGGTAGSSPASADERQAERTRQEDRLRDRIAGLLSRILSDGRFTVSVDVQLNFDTVREVNQRLLPQGDDGNGLVTRKRVQSPGGVPDAETGAGGRPGHEELEYAHSSSRQEIARASGRVERVSVAVVLPPDLDEFEVERIRSLVAAASGIDTERGDRLEVSRVRGDGAMSAAREIDALIDTPPAEVRINAPVASSTPAFQAWAMKLALVAAALVLGGVLVAAAAGPRRRRLGVEEREAALARLNAWIANGGSRP